MKKIIVVITCIFVALGLNAQKVDTIRVGYNKTVLLVFDSEIIFDDLGSPDVIMERVGNKLKVAAAIPNSPETSLFVETTNNKLYNFVVIYDANPKKLLYNYTSVQTEVIKKVEAPSNGIVVNTNTPTTTSNNTSTTINNKELNENCKKIENTENSISGKGILDKKMFFYLGDIYVKGDYLYFKLVIRNTSNIRIDIDLMKMVVRNKKGALKGAIQQDDVIVPTMIYNDNINEVAPKGFKNDRVVKIFVVDKFTIDNDKLLHFELWEKGGDRIVDFTINSNDILNVKAL